MSADGTCRTPLASALWLFLFACSGPATAPPEPAPRAVEPPGSETADSRATSDHMQEYYWYAGLTAVGMGSTSGRACFLTQVAGDFATDRYVRIYSFNGSWVLSGSSASSGADVGVVCARARCGAAYSYTGEYSWAQGQNPTPMGSIYGRACFLTRVGGGFGGTGERVEVYSGNTTSWSLGGSSKHFGVHARARCVTYPPVSAQQPYTYTGWVSPSSQATVLQPTTWKCYLAGIRGAFEGSGSKVTIYADGSFWRLAVRPHAVVANGAKVGCTR